MKYTINLFGYSTDVQLSTVNGKLQIEIPDEEQAHLQAYLVRVLQSYGINTEKYDPIEKLVPHAIAAEKNLNGHLNEPKLKLPYWFKPEIKDKLIEAAELQDMSATQLLIRIIERKYQSYFGKENL